MRRRTLVKTFAMAGSALAIAETLAAQSGDGTATPPHEGDTMVQDTPQTGYAPVNGLEMYYEIHGEGGVPLLLLHGGLFNIDLQFGGVIPGLSETRQVIAADFQAHGRTNDIDDRPLSTSNLASDVVGLLQHLGLGQVDVFGYSVGGAVALELAIRHPELIRKAVISSVSFSKDGDRIENEGAMEGMTVDMIAGTPMQEDYLAKSPNPDKLQQLLDKLVGFQSDDWTEDDIKGYPAPTLYTVGDCDMVKLDHAVRFLQLRGGDVNGDFVGVPANQLAVLPGTTHFFGLSRPSLILELVVPYLDAAMPEDVAATPEA